MNPRLGRADLPEALARLRLAEGRMAAELAAVRASIDRIEEAVAAGGSAAPGSVLLTVVEAARELRVSRSRVFELLAAGELEGVRIGRARCVPRRSIEAFLARLGAA